MKQFLFIFSIALLVSCSDRPAPTDTPYTTPLAAQTNGEWNCYFDHKLNGNIVGAWTELAMSEGIVSEIECFSFDTSTALTNASWIFKDDGTLETYTGGGSGKWYYETVQSNRFLLINDCEETDTTEIIRLDEEYLVIVAKGQSGTNSKLFKHE